MMLFIIIVLVLVYLVGGTVIGVAAHVNKAWPVYNKDSDSFNLEKTMPFFWACGPLFWIVLAFMLLFSKIWSMANWEE